MKKILILIIVIILLISGCSSIPSNGKDNLNNYDEIHIEEVPSEFYSEKEFIEGVKLLKQDKENKSEKVIGGKTGNSDELDKMDFYYMPVTIPSGYELHSITVVPDIFRSTYVKKGEKYDPAKSFDYGYYTVDGWTMVSAIKENKLVKSEYSDKIYFHFNTVQNRFSYASFEFDNIAFTIRFPYDISLNDEEQVKMIEELCQMEKKIIE